MSIISHTTATALALLLSGAASLAQTPSDTNNASTPAPRPASAAARAVLAVPTDGVDVLPERMDDEELATQRFELMVAQRWDAEWELRAARAELERHALGDVPPGVMSTFENAQDRADRLDRKLRVLWITHGLEVPDFAAHERAKRARSTHAFPKAAGHLAQARRERARALAAGLRANAPVPHRNGRR